MKELDEIDNKILELLRENSRRSFQEIASIIDMTDVTVRRRVKELKDRGVITKFTIDVDNEKVGRQFSAVIRLEMLVSHQKEVMKKVLELGEEIEELYYLAGKCGLWLKLSVKNIEAYETFIKEKLGIIEGISNIDSCIVLKTLK